MMGHIFKDFLHPSPPPLPGGPPVVAKSFEPFGPFSPTTDHYLVGKVRKFRFETLPAPLTIVDIRH